MRGNTANIRAEVDEIECEKLEDRAAREKLRVDEHEKHLRNLEDFIDSGFIRSVVDSYEHRVYLFATVEMVRQHYYDASTQYVRTLARLTKQGA